MKPSWLILRTAARSADLSQSGLGWPEARMVALTAAASSAASNGKDKGDALFGEPGRPILFFIAKSYFVNETS